MEPNEDFWAEIHQDGDSDDEVYEGFTIKELAESEQRRIKKDIATAQLVCDLENEIESEVFEEALSDEEEEVRLPVDPSEGAYNHVWLTEFDEVCFCLFAYMFVFIPRMIYLCSHDDYISNHCTQILHTYHQ